jgi:hypothetical protein
MILGGVARSWIVFAIPKFKLKTMLWLVYFGAIKRSFFAPGSEILSMAKFAKVHQFR